MCQVVFQFDCNVCFGLDFELFDISNTSFLGSSTLISICSKARVMTGLPPKTRPRSSGSTSDALLSALSWPDPWTKAGDRSLTFVCRSHEYWRRCGQRIVPPLKLGRESLILGPSCPLLASDGSWREHTGLPFRPLVMAERSMSEIQRNEWAADGWGGLARSLHDDEIFVVLVEGAREKSARREGRPTLLSPWSLASLLFT